MAEMMDLYNEAENSVLGTLIADAEVNASLVFTRVRPEDFVTGISRQIFETCRAMYGRGDVIDPLTVKAACGSEFATWLKELEQITPSARYCGAYVDKLLELSRRYRLQKLFREALDGNFGRAADGRTHRQDRVHEQRGRGRQRPAQQHNDRSADRLLRPHGH